MQATTTEAPAVKGVFEQVEEMGHEQVVFCNDQATGLRAIIGIHNTVLGPSLGGLRMWNYKTEAEALTDALRLSRGMTFKNAIAGLNLGGGKAVIIGDARKDKTEAKLRKFGRFVNSLGGKYYTAEDVGMSAHDIEAIYGETNYVSGKPATRGGLGDPSPFTAYSTYMGMKAAAKVAFGSDSLSGKKVALQGAGNVGEYLIQYLQKEGVEIIISEYYQPRLEEISIKYGLKTIALDEVYDLDVDIYAPCALGATINDDTIDRLKCQVIAGCANNQLKDEKKHGQQLLEKGIVYAPDFLINAGGVTNCYAEVVGMTTDWSWEHIESFYGKTLDILKRAGDTNTNVQEVAIATAMERINSIASIQKGM